MNIDERIREITKEEIDKAFRAPRYVPAQKFCSDVGISRVTLWRAEKEGRVKVQRIGSRLFVDANQTFA